MVFQRIGVFDNNCTTFKIKSAWIRQENILFPKQILNADKILNKYRVILLIYWVIKLIFSK